MNSTLLIINAQIVNEGTVRKGAVYIENDIIAEVFTDDQDAEKIKNAEVVIDAKDSYLLPGVIDDQVHFRQPGLTEKADIHTESRAAVAGGITSFMEMPNTIPQTTTIDLLKEKFAIGARESMANFSFYMGATNDNLEELDKIDVRNTCGIKVFMGSSTGNMLVDNPDILEKIFATAKTLITTHCEDEATIRKNLEAFKAEFGDSILPYHHPQIRSDKACFLSSEKAVKMARRNNTRLHVLHLSSGIETDLFDNQLPLEQKRITAEVCVHHLWFTNADYEIKGNLIKWNPAVKTYADRESLWQALLDNKLDVVATDHAPHLLAEKQNTYLSSPSGGPLVQHSLQAMADALEERNLPVHLLAQWMSHNPAVCYKIKNRGFIRKGYAADLVILQKGKKTTVDAHNILYKCKWSPFYGHTFHHTPTHTIVNGQIVHQNGVFNENFRGKALEFDR